MNLKRLLDEKGHSYTSVAKAIGVTPQAVYFWNGTRVPSERVLEVSKLTGIPKNILRPDIYPEELGS